MKSVLICHEEDALDRIALARWLGSFSDLAGIISIHEDGGEKWKRAQREWRRLGPWRFWDMLAYQFFARIFLNPGIRRQEEAQLKTLLALYPDHAISPEVLRAGDPNSPEAREFIARLAPDFMIARCKKILKPEIFAIPKSGTYVMHPGICPEYRNAHGCFWALARRDLHNVGATLLRVDAGIDTGPVLGYFRYPFDEANESHVEIQQKSVLANLPALRRKLEEAVSGKARAIAILGRGSRNWGQPWLTQYIRWKAMARRKCQEGRRINTLLFHDVTDAPATSGFSGPDADLYKMRVSAFSEFLHILARQRPFLLAPLGQEALADYSHILAFDDGGESAHSIIAPLLETLGWRGLFFVVTDCIGKPGFLNVAQLRDLQQRGHRIGSHSHTHPMRFSSLTDPQLEMEWQKSKEILESVLQAKILLASVPGGYYSRRVAKFAEAAGYRLLFNSEPVQKIRHCGRLKVLGRFSVRGDEKKIRFTSLASGKGWARETQYLGWNLKKVLKAVGGNAWLRARKLLLTR